MQATLSVKKAEKTVLYRNNSGVFDTEAGKASYVN